METSEVHTTPRKVLSVLRVHADPLEFNFPYRGQHGQAPYGERLYVGLSDFMHSITVAYNQPSSSSSPF
eukprot:3008997-Prymnesium_polylepis.1